MTKRKPRKKTFDNRFFARFCKLLLTIWKFFEGCPTRKSDIMGVLRGRFTPWFGVARYRFCLGAVKERFPAGASDGLTARTNVSSRSRFPRRRREFAKAAANPLFPLLPTEPSASCPLTAVYFNKVRRCFIWLVYRLSTIFKSFTVNISTLSLSGTPLSPKSSVPTSGFLFLLMNRLCASVTCSRLIH